MYQFVKSRLWDRVLIHTFSPFNPSDQIIFLGLECFLLKLMSLEGKYEETEKMSFKKLKHLCGHKKKLVNA